MGKFDGKFIHGLVGKAIFREYRGKQIVQALSPKKTIKRTTASKKASVVFGKSSILGSYIRAAFGAVIGKFYDGPMTARFNGELLFSLRSALNTETQTLTFGSNNFNRLAGFEFNAKSPLKNEFFAQPVLHATGKKLQIDLPEMHIPKDLKFPQGIKYCKVIISSALFDLTYGNYQNAVIESFDIKYENQHLTVPPKQFNFEIEPGCLCIVNIALQYYEKTFAGNVLINSKTFNPSAILSAFMVDGTVDKSRTEKWLNMEFKTK